MNEETKPDAAPVDGVVMQDAIDLLIEKLEERASNAEKLSDQFANESNYIAAGREQTVCNIICECIWHAKNAKHKAARSA